MRRLYLFGIIFLFMVLLFGCSSNSQKVDSNEVNELNNENSRSDVELSEKENREEIDETTIEEKQEKNNGNNSLPTPQQDRVSQEEMELLKETLRTYIFDNQHPNS